jgi:hypothetical protein
MADHVGDVEAPCRVQPGGEEEGNDNTPPSSPPKKMGGAKGGKTPRIDERTRTGTKIMKDKKVCGGILTDRLYYMFSILAIVWFWPLWLKFICLKYREAPTPIYNSSIGITMTAPALYSTATSESCSQCGGGEDVFYDVDVEVTHYESLNMYNSWRLSTRGDRRTGTWFRRQRSWTGSRGISDSR